MPAVDAIAEAAERAGIRNIHVLAWRDLDDPEAGGSELFVSRVMGVWARAGLNLRLRTSRAQGLASDIRRDGYRVSRRRGRLSVFPSAIASEMLRRDGQRPDAVVEAWNGIPFLSPVWFRGPRVAILHHVHEHMWPLVLPGSLARLGWLVEGTLAPPLYRRTPIVTNSTSSREEIIARLGLPGPNIRVAPPGIDDFWCPDPDVRRTPNPSIVAVGRLVPHKHFDALVRHAAAARRSVPDLTLTIVGEGYERPAIEATIDEVAGHGWISLPGRLDDAALRDHYRRAWVVAATSTAEGFGMTLTEAAACGTPAVATDIAGHRDAVVNQWSGILATSADDFVDGLVSLLSDAGRNAELSAGAVNRAGQLTWDRAAWDVFESLLGRGNILL